MNETLEEIAKRLPKELYNTVCFSCPDAFCKHWQEDASDVILSALRNERERCARIALDPYGDEVGAFSSDAPKATGEKIARAIREGKVNRNE